MTEESTTYKEKEIEELLKNSNLSFDNLKYLAKEVANNSWSPFSRFPVGSIVVGIDQNKTIKTFSGTNVEPAVHLSLCAERVAIYNGIAAGYKKFIAIAVSCPLALEKITTPDNEIGKIIPCGACREVILQKLDPKGIIIVDGLHRTFTPKEILPHPILDQNKLRSLTIEEMDALDHARRALHNAHTPFSKEKYGVAILPEESEIFSACTVDSHSFGCSVEPLKAVFGTFIAAKGIKNLKIKSIIFTYPFVRYPAGDTLQLISDYCKPDTKIIIDNMGVTTIEELLPWAFKLN